MCEIVAHENTDLKDTFFSNWKKYVVGILTYSEENSSQGIDWTPVVS